MTRHFQQRHEAQGYVVVLREHLEQEDSLVLGAGGQVAKVLTVGCHVDAVGQGSYRFVVRLQGLASHGYL